MTFNEILATLPTIDHLNEIKILENGKQVHQIPAAWKIRFITSI